MDSWFALTCFSLNNFVLLGLHTCIVNLKKRWRRNQMVWSEVVCSATKLKHMQVFEWDECTTAPSLQNMYIISCNWNLTPNFSRMRINLFCIVCFFYVFGFIEFFSCKWIASGLKLLNRTVYAFSQTFSYFKILN